MKAVRIHEFGGPETLHLEELPRPRPEPDEILVKVLAASVNPVDYKVRNGGYLPPDDLPLTLGRDVSGVVDWAPLHGAFHPGDAVYAMLESDGGGYAEFVAIKASHCARKPERLDYVQAAAVPLAGLTAWQGLFDQGGLGPGRTVLIHGASGGVGHFAVQFARVRGARVIATCAGEDADFVRRLGAEAVIDYHKERFEDRAHDVDLVFDLVGGETQERSWAALRTGGVMVSTLKEPDPKKAAAHEARGLYFVAKPDGAELGEIARLIDAKAVNPCVAGVFPLGEAGRAETRLETGHVRGKLVLDVQPG